MAIIVPLVGFFAGFFLIWLQGFTVPSEYASYLTLAAIAGIDTILGGFRSILEKKFRSDIFLSGFIVNTLMAALLAYFGDQIGVPDLYLAAVVALGGRIFLNLTLIRHYLLAQPRGERTYLNEIGIFSALSHRETRSSQPEELKNNNAESS